VKESKQGGFRLGRDQVKNAHDYYQITTMIRRTQVEVEREEEMR
jgi:hypothetical protein